MSSKPIVRDARRSTRVPLKVVIEAQGIAEALTCEGETIVVNLHGALISTAIPLSKDMKIKIEVNLTGKRANAEVVYIDPQQPLHCGDPCQSGLCPHREQRKRNEQRTQ